MGATREAVLGAKAWKQSGPCVRLWRHQTEEGVMLHTGLPQLLGGTMVSKLKTDGRFVLLEFARSYLDVEMVTLVRDLQDLWPSETVYAQPVGI